MRTNGYAPLFDGDTTALSYYYLFSYTSIYMIRHIYGSKIYNLDLLL